MSENSVESESESDVEDNDLQNLLKEFGKDGSNKNKKSFMSSDEEDLEEDDEDSDGVSSLSSGNESHH